MNELLLQLPGVAGPVLQDEVAGPSQARELPEHERMALPKQGSGPVASCPVGPFQRPCKPPKEAALTLCGRVWSL